MGNHSEPKEAVFGQIRARVHQRLEGLSPDLTYHDIHHTFDVVKQCERIAHEEGVTDEHRLFLLRVAGLYHDTGFLHTYRNHEEEGCQIFLTDAPSFGLDEEECAFVIRLIMATKLPQTPVDIYEQIICDADLDYLGRPDFFRIGDGLRREFLKYGVIQSDEEWSALQISFLSKHHYHTRSSQALREGPKQDNISRLL